MKKKACLLLIASTMALSSCSWEDLMFWRKWGWGKKDNKPADTEVVVKDDVIDAFDKLAKANSFTSLTKATLGGDNTLSVGDKKVPSYQDLSIEYVTKKVGKNTKLNSKISSITIVNLESAEAVEGVTKEETMSSLVTSRNAYIQFGYDASLSFDLAKQEATFVIPMVENETYTIYDEEAKQSYEYSVGDEHVRYNTNNKESNGLVDTATLIDIVNKGTIEGDTIHAEIDGDKVDIKFELKDGYVSTLEAEVEGTHLKISYSDFDKTSFDIPASCHKPTCKWPHNAKNSYLYEKTETGHRKYCSECHKFLDEEKAHVHSHNDKGYCEICGYIDGQDDANSEVIPGFELEGDEYYLKAKVVGDVIVSATESYNHDYDASEVTSTSNTHYKVFTSAAVVFVTTIDNREKLEGSCVEMKTTTYDLYKNLSQSELETIKALGYGTERTAALKTYLAAQTKSATFSGKTFSSYHGVLNSETIKLDDCHDIYCYTCSDCGEITSCYINSVADHESGFVKTEEKIDDCHTLVKEDCPTCHEHKENIVTSHVEGEPVVENIKIDSCYTLRIEKCATCGEVLSKTIVANHGDHISTRVVDDGNGGTKTITCCDDCHTVLSIE